MQVEGTEHGYAQRRRDSRNGSTGYVNAAADFGAWSGLVDERQEMNQMSKPPKANANPTHPVEVQP